jgi:hypothetical protein
MFTGWKKRSALLACVVCMFYTLISLPAVASPITFTFDYKNVGITVGALNYPNAHITITATADTSGLYFYNPTTPMLNYSSMTLDIQGVGTGTFSDSGYVFVAGQTVGFGTLVNYDLAYIAGLPIVSYDLISSIGPIVGFAAAPGQWVNVPTSLGSTTLGDFGVTIDGGTFTARVVPEPGSFVLLISGLAALGIAASRRKSK